MRFSPLDLSEASVSQTGYPGTEGMSGPGAPGAEITFDVSEHVPAELENERLACVVGLMESQNEDGDERRLRFKTLVRLWGALALAGVAPSAEYYIFLEAGRSGYTEAREISIKVPPNEVEHFLLRVGTDRSAEFDLEVVLRTVSGDRIPVDDVTLEILTPVYDPLRLRAPDRHR